MREFKKAIWMVLLSTPLLFGVNRLTNSVNAYSDPSLLFVGTEAISTQGYDTGADLSY